MSFHPENWARPSNATIEGSQFDDDESRYSTTTSSFSREKELPKSPGGPPTPPPHAHAYDQATTPKSTMNPYSGGQIKDFDFDLPRRPVAAQHLSPTGGQSRSQSENDSRSVSEDSRLQDPNRHSRESDTTSSTRQQASTESSADTSASSVSGGPNDACDSRGESVIEEPGREASPVPQLQYHHQSLLPRTNSVPLESQSRKSSSTDIAEQGMAINRHLTPNNNPYGRRTSMQRPASSYSVYSERGLSPSGHVRAASAQARKSPDNRPQSYVELLNVPYPQPAPAPITLDNSHLRNSIGVNASLLSAQKTLEMYRQNVKKTNDFSIQYSFAIFLISSAQEQGLTFHEPSRGKNSPKPANKEEGESSPIELVREAKAILTKLANGGYPFAQYYLADGYASGIFNKGKEDYNAAFPLFILAAKHGHAESAFRAGLCYEFGWGCRKDPAKAVQYLRTAASKNHPGAMTRLGKACLSGDLGEKRYREGLKWLTRATESADAMYNAAPYHLGCMYETGYGEDVFKDESYAAELFTQAAELGHAEASFRMGDAYEHGKLNCPRDPALSVHFYTGAAEAGHAAAMMGLCAWYMVGADPIMEKDEEEAYEWARRSAEQGESILPTANAQDPLLIRNAPQASSRQSMQWVTSPRWVLGAEEMFWRPMCGTSRPPILATNVPSRGWPPSVQPSVEAGCLWTLPRLATPR